MSTTMTRFEVICPLFADSDPHQQTWNTFLSNLGGLAPYVLTNIYQTSGGNQSSFNQVYGYITAAQQSTALGYLNALNSGLGFNVQCSVWTTTSEP